MVYHPAIDAGIFIVREFERHFYSNVSDSYPGCTDSNLENTWLERELFLTLLVLKSA